MHIISSARSYTHQLTLAHNQQHQVLKLLQYTSPSPYQLCRTVRNSFVLRGSDACREKRIEKHGLDETW